jgi:Ca2+-binding EF-hand superfamily protein
MKVHIILRNSFVRLKEAMRIYDQQDIPLSEDEFKKVFKKLDLTDLVITQNEIKEIYDKFKCSNGTVNQEKLLCAIA